jgi:hypothetical protein
MVELPLTSSTFVGLAADATIPWKQDEFVLEGQPLFQLKPSGSLTVSLAAGLP